MELHSEGLGADDLRVLAVIGFRPRTERYIINTIGRQFGKASTASVRRSLDKLLASGRLDKVPGTLLGYPMWVRTYAS